MKFAIMGAALAIAALLPSCNQPQYQAAHKGAANYRIEHRGIDVYYAVEYTQSECAVYFINTVDGKQVALSGEIAIEKLTN